MAAFSTEDLQDMTLEEAAEACKRHVVEQEAKGKKQIPRGAGDTRAFVKRVDKIAENISKNKKKSFVGLTLGGMMVPGGGGPFLGATIFGAAVLYNKWRGKEQNKSFPPQENLLPLVFSECLKDLGMDDETRKGCMTQLAALPVEHRKALMESMVTTSLTKTLGQYKQTDAEREVQDITQQENADWYRGMLVEGAGYPQNKVDAAMKQFHSASSDQQLTLMNTIKEFCANNSEACQTNRIARVNECRERIIEKFSDPDVCAGQLLAHGSKVRYDGSVYDVDAVDMPLYEQVKAEQYIQAVREKKGLPLAVADPSARYEHWLVNGFGVSKDVAETMISDSRIKEMSYSEAMDTMYDGLLQYAEGMSPEQEQAQRAALQTGRKTMRQKIVEHFMASGSGQDGQTDIDTAALHLDNFRRMRTTEYDLSTVPSYTWGDLSPAGRNNARGELFYEQRQMGLNPAQIGAGLNQRDLEQIRQIVERDAVKKQMAHTRDTHHDTQATHAEHRLGIGPLEFIDLPGGPDTLPEPPAPPSAENFEFGG